MTINLYISKDFKGFYDQLKAIADSNNRSYAECIGTAVKEYIQKTNDEVELINEKGINKFIRTANKEELLEMSTLICNINNKIIRECQK